MALDSLPDNIQRFNLIAVHLFAKLYASFPVPLEVEPLALGHAAVPEESDGQITWDMGAEAADAITWLEEEGFVCVQAKMLDGRLHSVRLTLKAMTVLGHLPDAVSPVATKRSLIARMKEVVTSAGARVATEAASALMAELFSVAVRIAFKPDLGQTGLLA